MLSFADEGAWRGYLADPERLSHRTMLAGELVDQRVVEALTDVS